MWNTSMLSPSASQFGPTVTWSVPQAQAMPYAPVRAAPSTSVPTARPYAQMQRIGLPVFSGDKRKFEACGILSLH